MSKSDIKELFCCIVFCAVMVALFLLYLIVTPPQLSAEADRLYEELQTRE